MKNYCLRTGWVVVGLGVVGMFLLTACGSRSTASNQDKQKASLGATIVMANAAINHSPNGTADLVWDPATQKLAVKLQISGLTPRSVYPVDIHAGPCQQPGDIKYVLTNLVAGISGVASSTTTLENVKSDLSQASWSINIHNGASAQPGMQRLIISCADVHNTTTKGPGMQTAHLMLGAAYAPNQQASGVAQLRLVDTSLSVTVTMTGLTPKSVHTAYIYTGSCEAQGGVVYSLKPISADSQGNGSSFTVLNGVNHVPAHGWYINVHLTGNSSVHMQNDSIACGNVQTAG